MYRAKLTATAMLPLWLIGCSGGNGGDGTNQGSGNSVQPRPSTTGHIAIMVELKMPAGPLLLTALADKGHAGDQVGGAGKAITRA